MRRALVAIAAVAAIVVVVVLLSRGGGDEGYVVRAIFDNSSFMVQGEEVRVAGATVGEIESVDVTMPGEIDSMPSESASFGEGRSVPGKAAVVMKITDPGFQDFRRDASCIIRPQSLIGEKFVDCRPTQPRAASSGTPPSLWKIPSGQPGAGQHLLPVENNSTSVDPDLVNNIQRLPYLQRFRIILNELGATLAGRGEDIEAVVKRANPVLRDTDRLFGILSEQRDELAQLSADSEQILRPLARERAHFAGFFSNSGAAAQASSERGADLEAALERFPRFLREFRSTLRSLKGFSDAATPVFSELGRAAPSLTRATRELTPFTAASTVSLRSLGAAGEAAGPKFRASDRIIRKIRDLAVTGVSPTTELAKFLVNIKKTKGFDGIVDLIYNGGGSINEYDQYGHFLRSLVTLVDCLDYELHGRSGCDANFTGSTAVTSGTVDPEAMYQRLQEELAEESGGTAAGSISSLPPAVLEAQPPAGQAPGLGEGQELGASAPSSSKPPDLMSYLLGAR
jgi:ABC-type transporter Mla subunit MlaD